MRGPPCLEVSMTRIWCVPHHEPSLYGDESLRKPIGGGGIEHVKPGGIHGERDGLTSSHRDVNRKASDRVLRLSFLGGLRRHLAGHAQIEKLLIAQVLHHLRDTRERVALTTTGNAQILGADADYYWASFCHRVPRRDLCRASCQHQGGS